MMKKLFTLFLLIVLIFSFNTITFADDTIKVVIDGSYVDFDVEPQIIDGRTMVPIRAIFEKMGATVEWDSKARSATCTKADTVVKMTVDSKTIYTDNQATKMDVSPVIINGRTLAPARYVAEAFGATVQWSQKNNTVVICSKDVYAYVDYPDIPDLGRCYNIPLISEQKENGVRVLTYVYSDFSNDDYHSYLYDNSALVLGGYIEEAVAASSDSVIISYTKRGEDTPTYLVGAGYDDDGSILFVVMIPYEEAPAPVESKVTLYAMDGRTIDVLESEVEAYLKVGWYRTLEETQQTMYAPDGRTLTVYKAEVQAYKNVGWYETKSAAQAANKPQQSTTTKNPTADGYYYRTPTGKRYHLDPNCGGKNSYRTTNLSGLTPCKKCAQ